MEDHLSEENLRAICAKSLAQIDILKMSLATPALREEANRQAREIVRDFLQFLGALKRTDSVEFREGIELANFIVREARDLIKRTTN